MDKLESIYFAWTNINYTDIVVRNKGEVQLLQMQ